MRRGRRLGLLQYGWPQGRAPSPNRTRAGDRPKSICPSGDHRNGGYPGGYTGAHDDLFRDAARCMTPTSTLAATSHSRGGRSPLSYSSCMHLRTTHSSLRRRLRRERDVDQRRPGGRRHPVGSGRPGVDDLVAGAPARRV